MINFKMLAILQTFAIFKKIAGDGTVLLIIFVLSDGNTIRISTYLSDNFFIALLVCPSFWKGTREFDRWTPALIKVRCKVDLFVITDKE